MRALGWRAPRQGCRSLTPCVDAVVGVSPITRAAPSLHAKVRSPALLAALSQNCESSLPRGALLRGVGCRSLTTTSVGNDDSENAEPASASGAPWWQRLHHPREESHGSSVGGGGGGGSGSSGGPSQSYGSLGGGGGGSGGSGGPSQSYGSLFLQEVAKRRRRQQEIEEALGMQTQAAAAAEEKAADAKDRTMMQIERLLKELPGQVSMAFAYKQHLEGKAEPQVLPALPKEEFEAVFRDARQKFLFGRRREVGKRRRTRRNYMRLNLGYTEEETIYEPEEAEFLGDWRTESMKEDYWKAEYYQQLQRFLKHYLPESEPMAALRTDRLADVTSAALREHISSENRPVLTHELADFENPFMMKQSATARILHERCVRNQLDEKVLPRLLERQPDLVKLRARAPLPPEVMEPLAAFRGDVRWNFNPRERLSHKLDSAECGLAAVLGSKGDVAAVVDALPENRAPDPGQVPGLHHPWKNHVGFESAVPRGIAGGTMMGRPEPAVEEQLHRLRYPTMQRVAHTLPRDPKWRAHVVRSINVLERSKHWDYASKLKAVNSMKEVYEYLKPSAEYSSMLDEKLPLNRAASHLWKKFVPGAQYVKTFPKKFRKLKTHTRYRPSLTATAPRVDGKKNK